MVPVEPISLSIGIAALFTTCIQLFEYFKAATALERTLDCLLIKLEFEQERLLVWGEVLGIGGKEWSELSTFADENKWNLVRRCLNAIKCLLEDADNLKSRYGMRHTSAATGVIGCHSIILARTL